jgi:hypothetical protein
LASYCTEKDWSFKCSRDRMPVQLLADTIAWKKTAFLSRATYRKFHHSLDQGFQLSMINYSLSA